MDDPAFCLENLVRDVLTEVKKVEAEHGVCIPVIAAGGVYDGADIRRFLEMGASGVQMGTRFVATHECDADAAFKQSYLDAKAEDLMVIKSPVGLPGRPCATSFCWRRPRDPTPLPLPLPLHQDLRPGDQPLLHRLGPGHGPPG
ncbi:NAD(P)H-dependent flavin oxidoreductase [Desulfosarcina cetonica]|uniref:NAD(P)H-dependent flavin oxidoreductase n=1 Tax=Desulfosarcina cetonica TaxID=90730 RepID=UPI001C4835F7|nr:nitronate monooxygenase [Desulfosarcina cetonica]